MGPLRELKKRMGAVWSGVRTVLGDDAYERYLAHWHAHHAADGAQPLDRKAFFRQELERRWGSGDIRRCC